MSVETEFKTIIKMSVGKLSYIEDDFSKPSHPLPDGEVDWTITIHPPCGHTISFEMKGVVANEWIRSPTAPYPNHVIGWLDMHTGAGTGVCREGGA